MFPSLDFEAKRRNRT